MVTLRFVRAHTAQDLAEDAEREGEASKTPLSYAMQKRKAACVAKENTTLSVLCEQIPGSSAAASPALGIDFRVEGLILAA